MDSTGALCALHIAYITNSDTKKALENNIEGLLILLHQALATISTETYAHVFAITKPILDHIGQMVDNAHALRDPLFFSCFCLFPDISNQVRLYILFLGQDCSIRCAHRHVKYDVVYTRTRQLRTCFVTKRMKSMHSDIECDRSAPTQSTCACTCRVIENLRNLCVTIALWLSSPDNICFRCVCIFFAYA